LDKCNSSATENKEGNKVSNGIQNTATHAHHFKSHGMNSQSHMYCMSKTCKSLVQFVIKRDNLRTNVLSEEKVQNILAGLDSNYHKISNMIGRRNWSFTVVCVQRHGINPTFPI